MNTGFCFKIPHIWEQLPILVGKFFVSGQALLFLSLPARDLLLSLQIAEAGFSPRGQRLCPLLDGDLTGGLETRFSLAESRLV